MGIVKVGCKTMGKKKCGEKGVLQKSENVRKLTFIAGYSSHNWPGALPLDLLSTRRPWGFVLGFDAEEPLKLEKANRENVHRVFL